MRPPWDEAYWRQFEADTRKQSFACPSDAAAWSAIARRSRLVLRAYSTSFFLVTRFLPARKRAQVEAIYAAVRLPDEIVDSFPLSAEDATRALDRWTGDYEQAIAISSVKDRLAAGVPPILAAFAEVVRTCGIPPEYYRAFLSAMRHDITPREFSDLDDLIEGYVYGSAIVVGYFLAYVYGPSTPAAFPLAIESSRSLGIALQLTNFLRDVGEDQRRGRIYLPLDFLRAEGLGGVDIHNAAQLPALRRVLERMSAIAEIYYAEAESGLDAFSPDCRTAIRACIDVYRQLNLRIGRSAEGVRHRESVPMHTKFQVLPASKYWRVPLALMGAI